MKLKEIESGRYFKFANNVALTGVYYRTERLHPSNTDHFYVHEVGIPFNVFCAHEDTEIIPVENGLERNTKS